VQDWFWWKTEGDPIFNSNYHDVAQDLDALHKENVHTMISVWGLLDPESETYKILDRKHELVSDAHVYDASNPEARDISKKRLMEQLKQTGLISTCGRRIALRLLRISVATANRIRISASSYQGTLGKFSLFKS
jgi:hypothetical protein